jgi:hypothetical protein
VQAGVRIQHYFHMRNLTCGSEVKCGCDSGAKGALCCMAGGECVQKYLLRPILV